MKIRLRAASAVAAAILALTGCGAPASTTAQAASAITRTQDEMFRDMEYFKPNRCPDAYARLDRQNEEPSCDEALGRVRQHAKTMKSDLEAVKPWSPEVSDLAGKTVEDLGQLISATEEKGNLRGRKTGAAGTIVLSHLKAWKAFGT